jgi:hypothetical protein
VGAAGLFTSIEAYRTFVKRWRLLYKELTARLRAGGIVGGFHQAEWNVKHCLRLGIKAGIRPGRKEAAEKAQLVLDLPMSADLSELADRNVPSYLREDGPDSYQKRKPKEWAESVRGYRNAISSDATMLIQSRLAGKRWVKQYHPWRFPDRVRQESVP